jgi:hypothetical protein
VLALISLAALSATAFLASSRLDRLAGRPLADVARLEMAMSSGQAMAIATLQAAVGQNYSRIVTYWRTNETNELGYLLVGAPSNNGPSVVYYPLFSAAGMSNALNPTNSTLLDLRCTNSEQGRYLADVGAFIGRVTAFGGGQSTTIQLLGHTANNPRTSPPVGWITLYQKRRLPGQLNETSLPVARLAYFVEDLQGLIDVERMGGQTNRESGTNPAEISVSNAYGTMFTNRPTATNAENRVRYVTPGMVLTVNGLTNPNDASQMRYFATGLRSWGAFTTNSNGTIVTLASNVNGFFPRIPYAVQVSSNQCYRSFSDARLTNYLVPRGASNTNNLRLNLSALVQGNSSSNSTRMIAAALAEQLPNFTNRAGGMNGSDYLLNLAANIVDYVDTDDITTYIAPNVRGVESVAWPNEIIYQIRFTDVDTLATGGGFQYAFKFKQYLETWNIHNVDVPSVPLIISNNLEILVRIPGVGGNTFTLASLVSDDQKVQVATTVALSSSILRPGEFGMLETPEQTFIYVAEGATSITNVIFQDCGDNRVVISQTNSGSPPLTRTIDGMQIYAQTNQGNQLTTGPGWLTANQFASAILAPSVYRSGVTTVGGDPRAQFFLREWQVKCSPYINYSSPGGRNYEQGNSGFANSEVNPQTFWADGGKTVQSDRGANPASFNQKPDTLYNSKLGTWSTNLALARINNTGSFSNLCELGNIFDPIQWADTGGLPATAGGQRGLWTNLTTSSVIDARFCGRSSLRIGRPEFNRFAFTNYGGNPVPNMGMSAVALLDLFAVTNTAEDFGGRINLNTAPGPVLAALAGNCMLRSDPSLVAAIGAGGTNFRIPAPMATIAFVRGVQKFRQAYPFHTPSQLAFISPHPLWPTNWPQDAVFGNTNTIASANNARIGVSVWNDSAAEEWFSKIHKLGAVDSWNYRCYVVAQLLNTNGTPKGSAARKYYQIYTRPNPGQQGFSTVVTYESPY